MRPARTIALFATVALLSAAGGGAYYLWSDAAGKAEGEVMERVLAAPIADLAGGTRSLAQWRGRVLVINYWATWCAPCREEIPVFVKMQERHAGRGLQFVGIAIDQPEKVAEFAREFRINYPLLMGGADTLELMRQAGNRAGVLPYTLVIDREGKLASRQPGGIKEDRLERLIQPLL